VADFNQFGSLKPSQGSDPQHCAQCEAMLADALDGALSATDHATFDLHMVGCPNCATMLADAQRGASWMEMLKSPRPEPPTTLLERILAETSGKAAAEAAAQVPKVVLGPTDRLRVQPPTTILGRPAIPAMAQPAFASAKVIPFRTRITTGFRSLGQTMLQPRLAMTAAMAFFSIALTLNLTGVRLSDLRASDFKPSSIMRSASQAKASVVRNFDNLRVVYELESRVRDLQRSSDDNGPSTTSAPQNSPNAGQQPGDPNQKSAPQKQDKKQTKPNPGSSRRETPSSVQLVLSVPQAIPPFADKHFVVFTPSVLKQEGGLV
jgi:hypothetical protein